MGTMPEKQLDRLVAAIDRLADQVANGLTNLTGAVVIIGALIAASNMLQCAQM